jgi:hypothetical protein
VRTSVICEGRSEQDVHDLDVGASFDRLGVVHGEIGAQQVKNSALLLMLMMLSGQDVVLKPSALTPSRSD